MTDAPLWLPPHADHTKNSHKTLLNSDFIFPSEFPYEFGMSSPSVAGSTETESSDGEEDFFAGLTRRLSLTSFLEPRKQLPINSATFSEIPRKSQGLVGSPQSTLTGIGSWSGEGSPNGYSRVPSPPTTSFEENNDPWEVIYAAAGQIARMKLNSGNNQVPHLDFHNNTPLLTQTHPRPNQLSRPKQQCASVWGRPTKPDYLVPQQQLRSRVREFGHETLNAKWPPLQLQQQNNNNSNRVQFGGSGSRVAVPAVKKGCGGTGVFLPRHYETPSSEPPRMKTGCAPVLFPAKVVHALNLNIDDLNGAGQPRFSNAFATDYDAILARRNALLMQQQRLSVRREEAANYEIRLPQEWTY